MRFRFPFLLILLFLSSASFAESIEDLVELPLLQITVKSETTDSRPEL